MLTETITISNFEQGKSAQFVLSQLLSVTNMLTMTDSIVWAD